MLFITFNIHVMNVLAFLTVICFRYHLWFYWNKSFYHSRIWRHPTTELCEWSFYILDPRLFLIANWFVKNKDTLTQCLSFCAQLYSTEGSSGRLDLVLNPAKWAVVLVKAGRWQVYYGLNKLRPLPEATWLAITTPLIISPMVMPHDIRTHPERDRSIRLFY